MALFDLYVKVHTKLHAKTAHDACLESYVYMYSSLHTVLPKKRNVPCSRAVVSDTKHPHIEERLVSKLSSLIFNTLRTELWE